jgi:hypothetical protein
MKYHFCNKMYIIVSIFHPTVRPDLDLNPTGRLYKHFYLRGTRKPGEIIKKSGKSVPGNRPGKRLDGKNADFC